MYWRTVSASDASDASEPLRASAACWRMSGWAWYRATVISSPVTPGDVAPPLSPVNGCTHGGAYVSGTATVPRSTSHVGPQSILERFDAFSVTGPEPAVPPLVGGVACFASSPLPATPTITMTSAITTMPATNGR